jgi:hypothetical protein
MYGMRFEFVWVLPTTGEYSSFVLRGTDTEYGIHLSGVTTFFWRAFMGGEEGMICLLTIYSLLGGVIYFIVETVFMSSGGFPRRFWEFYSPLYIHNLSNPF